MSKGKFLPYYPVQAVEKGLSEGWLIQGTLRINPRKYDDAYVTNPNPTSPDIIVQGMQKRNRALHGDVVVVDLLKQDEWLVLDDKLAEFLEEGNNLTADDLALKEKTIRKQSNEEQPKNSVAIGDPQTSSMTPAKNNQTQRPPKKFGKAETAKTKFETQETVSIDEEKEPDVVIESEVILVTSKSDSQPTGVLGSTQGMTHDEQKETLVGHDHSTRNKTRRGARGKKNKNKKNPNDIRDHCADGSENPQVETEKNESEIVAQLEEVTLEIKPEESRESKIKKVGNNKRRVKNSSPKKTNVLKKPSESDMEMSLEPVVGEENLDQASGKKRKNRKGMNKKLTKVDEKENIVTSPDNGKKPKKKVILDSARNSFQMRKVLVPDLQYPIKEVLKHPKWESFVQMTGRVVRIVEMKHSRKAAGHLSFFPDQRQDFAKFRATDSRIPNLRIPRHECPENFFTRPEDFKQMLFIAEIKQWEYVSTAEGSITKNLGDGCDIDAQTEALLLEKCVITEEFSDKVIACLPADLPFTIPEEEIKKRRDFRDDCVFTIDPMTARDLDDALSVSELPDNKFRVGVHIADVSYFVKENTDLDQAAMERATSIYLVQKVIPMLPRTLCEDLCSLNPDVDRLTFSVEWILNENADIESQWFGRSVIKSCSKLAYEHAQSMLIEPNRDWDKEKEMLPPISAPWTAKDLSAKVNMLQKLALKLRQKREDNGALRLDCPKLCFALDKETGLPMSYQLYEHKHSNKLIEEFMLLANISVAKKIYETFPSLAVLRNHKPPKENMIEELERTFQKLDIELDFTDSKSLRKSLDRIVVNDQMSQAVKHVIINMVSKPMELATYICSGSYELDDREKILRHYALSVPLYTHFTSPIRRYPDVLVHRLLDAAIKGKDMKHWNIGAIKSQASLCNDKKLVAKQVGDQSAELFLALFIRSCGPINVQGVVMEIKSHSMDVLIVDMASQKRVYFDPVMRLLECQPSYSKQQTGCPEIGVQWAADIENGFPNRSVEVFKMFSLVNLTLHPSEGKPFEYFAVLNRSKTLHD